MDGSCQVVHPSGRQGPEERWYELRSHSAFHHPPFRDRIHGDFSRLEACQEARGSHIRYHSLNLRGLVNIKKNTPVTIIINI